MTDVSQVINNDLLFISYFMRNEGWNGVSKSTFQRVLYFSAALSPIFLPDEEWVYDFSNTLFGPYNGDISIQLYELHSKGLLILDERIIHGSTIKDKYSISEKGVHVCENTFFRLNTLNNKVGWFKTIVKTLSIYGENFLSKIVKEDPNVLFQNQINRYSKIVLDDSSNNLSKEFFTFIKSHGKTTLNLELSNDQDYLLLFFDVLYRKYKGGMDG